MVPADTDSLQKATKVTEADTFNYTTRSQGPRKKEIPKASPFYELVLRVRLSAWQVIRTHQLVRRPSDLGRYSAALDYPSFASLASVEFVRSLLSAWPGYWPLAIGPLAIFSLYAQFDSNNFCFPGAGYLRIWIRERGAVGAVRRR